MDKKSQSEDLEFYKFVDKILWEDWDPIGVNVIDSARDEYYSYLPQIIFLAKQNTNSDIICKYLLEIERVNMGLKGNVENCRNVALKIMKRKEEIFETS